MEGRSKYIFVTVGTFGHDALVKVRPLCLEYLWFLRLASRRLPRSLRFLLQLSAMATTYVRLSDQANVNG
jgi:hypothetical protein